MKKPQGRPPRFKDEAAFIKCLEDYKQDTKETAQMKNIAGFCAFAGIHRTIYFDYKKKYPEAGKIFEAVIENAWVQRLGGTSPVGAIFFLKNHFKEHYKDRHETDITSKGEAFAATAEIKELSDKFNEFLKRS